MPGYHSPRSPSAAHRWIACPGAPKAEEDIRNTGSDWAAEGTFLHDIAASCLMTGLEAEDFRGKKRRVEGRDFEVTGEHVAVIQPGLDWIREQRGAMRIEERVYLDPVLPGESGSVDVQIVNRSHLVVFDWKFGLQPVSAERNEQLMLYALGVLLSSSLARDVEDITLVIWQPRVEGGVSTWRTTRRQVERFGDYARERWELSRQAEPPREAGVKQCHWCRAKDRCKTFAAHNLAVFSAKFEDLDRGAAPVRLENEYALTPERRSYIIRNWTMVSKWFERLHALAIDDAIQGHPVPGFKLVDGRAGAREWTDEAKAEEELRVLLGRERHQVKLITPTEAEKRLTTREYAGLKGIITNRASKPVLVDSNDDRPAKKTSQDKFKELERHGR